MRKMKIGIGLVVLLAAVLAAWASGTSGFGLFTGLQSSQRMNDDSVITRTMNMYPYEMDEPSATVIYRRYQGGTGTVLIIKITSGIDGTITRWEKSYDTWANRATATYIPVNDWQ